MTNKLNRLLGVGLLAGSMALSAQSASAGILDKLHGDDVNAKQLATVKVTLTDAIAKASSKQSGTPVKAKLEKDDGKLVYDIEFLDNGKEIEMVVDAITGEVRKEDEDTAD